MLFWELFATLNQDILYLDVQNKGCVAHISIRCFVLEMTFIRIGFPRSNVLMTYTNTYNYNIRFHLQQYDVWSQ